MTCRLLLVHDNFAGALAGTINAAGNYNPNDGIPDSIIGPYEQATVEVAPATFQTWIDWWNGSYEP